MKTLMPSGYFCVAIWLTLLTTKAGCGVTTMVLGGGAFGFAAEVVVLFEVGPPVGFDDDANDGVEEDEVFEEEEEEADGGIRFPPGIGPFPSAMRSSEPARSSHDIPDAAKLVSISPASSGSFFILCRSSLYSPELNIC